MIMIIIRNKMNPHNLAICFAPVLMLDTSDYLDLQVVNIMFYHYDDLDDDQNYDQSLCDNGNLFFNLCQS